VGGIAHAAQAAPGVVMTARAVIRGAPGSGIEGQVRFVQTPAREDYPLPTVEVIAQVRGLTPGRHGFHIHETGVCEPPGYTTAGGHFDPGPFGNSTPVDGNHPYHLGDLPPLEANAAGVAELRVTTSRITLTVSPGNQLTVFDANGSAVIVHANPDLATTGVVGSSGGPRVACGVIERERQ
jgi:Cu-Zn family superoxide dismutase